jgi:hypothetical protein
MKYFSLISVSVLLTSCAKINSLLGPEGALIVERAAEGVAEAEQQAFPQPESTK